MCFALYGGTEFVPLHHQSFGFDHMFLSMPSLYNGLDLLLFRLLVWYSGVQGPDVQVAIGHPQPEPIHHRVEAVFVVSGHCLGSGQQRGCRQ